jgi:hypothetical protein
MLLIYVVVALIGAFSALLGVLCSPYCDFRDSSDSPIGVSLVEAAKVYSSLSSDKGKELMENCQACNDNKSTYKELEEWYEYQRPINILVFQVLIPIIVYLSFGTKADDYFRHLSYAGGYIVSLLISRLCFHLQVYKESPKPRISAPYPSISDPDYFFDYWDEESYRSYEMTSYRKASMKKMFDGASSFQKIICVYGIIPIIYGFLR